MLLNISVVPVLWGQQQHERSPPLCWSGSGEHALLYLPAARRQVRNTQAIRSWTVRLLLSGSGA